MEEEVSFKLHKSVTNSKKLGKLIKLNEGNTTEMITQMIKPT